MVDTTQLQATLDKIPAYTWYANPTGGLTFVNTRSADYLVSRATIRCDSVPRRTRRGIPSRICASGRHRRDAASLVRCLKTGSAGEVSFRARNADGAYRWFLSRAEPLRATDGAILYWIGSTSISRTANGRRSSCGRSSTWRADHRVWAPDANACMRTALRSLLRCHLEEWRQRGFGPEVHPDDFDRVKTLVDRSVANPPLTSWRCGSGGRRDLSLVSGSVQSTPRRPGATDSVVSRV